MPEAHELMEHMEHAASHGHGHGGSGSLGKYVGITMATLGVLLALASALLGGQRTELIATMVEQSNTGTKYQAISTKYRIMLAQLQQLHSLAPNAEKFKEWDDQVRKLQGEISSADVARLSRIVRTENAKNLDAEIPTHGDLMQFVTKIKALEKEQEAAREWTESYDAAVKTHSQAAERYEWAQLASEIGIVIASIALLFMSRGAWLGSVVLGMATVLIAGMTFYSSSTQLHAAEQKIEEAQKSFEAFNSDAKAKILDEELLKAVEEDTPPVVDPK